MEKSNICYLSLLILLQSQFYGGNCELNWNYRSFIHRFWPSNNEAENLQMNSTNDMTFSREEKHTGSSRTLVYGSPICVGRCIILQVFWSNSSTSLLGVKLPKFPTFPKPRVISK